MNSPNCPQCGSELIDSAKFCNKCGYKVTNDNSEEVQEREENADQQCSIEQEDNPDVDTETGETSELQSQSPLEENNTGKRKKKILTVSVVLLAVLLLVGGIVFAKCKVDEKHLREQLTTLLDGAENCERWTEEAEKRFDMYPMTIDEKQRYDALLSKKFGQNSTHYKAQVAYLTEFTALETEVKARLNDEAEKLFSELKSIEPTYASDEQKQRLAKYATDMEKMIKAGEYKLLPEYASEWRAFAENAAKKKTGYMVRVMQYDFTEYPKVRVYLDVKSLANGKMITGLTPNMFYVSEKDAKTGDFLNCAISKAVQMNENECLNINMLADISGSMMGENIDSAKSIMKNFLGTVQFSAGDKVKLTPFNSTIEKLGNFKSDINSLNSEINGYQASGQTKLYDSIVYGVQDASAQVGAKCVLAFTDGMDVGSYNAAKDVINVVSQYNVPVFIVRIGDESSSSEDGLLTQIAEASGGSFKNLLQFSSDLTTFYNQIYRQLKQCYVVEYDSLKVTDLADATCFSLYVQNQNMGGETELTVNPGKELFDTLLGAYLRSYICDMNSHSYNQIANYVDATTDSRDKYSIQWQMKKQVSGGFGEIEKETLMDYTVTGISLQDDGTVLLSSNENYDAVYYETIGGLRKINPTIAKKTIEFLSDNYGYDSVPDTEWVRVWVRVNQTPQYILTKASDGRWKFSKFAGKINFGPIQVYDVETNY